MTIISRVDLHLIDRMIGPIEQQPVCAGDHSPNRLQIQNTNIGKAIIMTRILTALAVFGTLAAGLVTLPAAVHADVAAPYPGTIEMKTAKTYGALVRA